MKTNLKNLAIFQLSATKDSSEIAASLSPKTILSLKLMQVNWWLLLSLNIILTLYEPCNIHINCKIQPTSLWKMKFVTQDEICEAKWVEHTWIYIPKKNVVSKKCAFSQIHFNHINTINFKLATTMNKQSPKNIGISR